MPLRAQQPPKVFLNRRLSPRARTDLDQIWSFIATDNEHAADAVIELITQTFNLLTQNPGAGRRRPELSPTVLSFPVGSYLVFYTAEAGAIRIARVLHGRQDITPKDIAP
ncbi:type II toxin-antitoxin system RelE/ParE family toxin [Rhodopseudomonas palustris]|uniref:type II toxin-antitoxin system RelE/ParE family toxin n=1 Tax=Rhodopseudomonas palustris TaxID=1076 RepID=UPI001F316A14|nr:type II toxin-antitoxin system RelE/ParE family toxin [Rhodopseudomonas palustris]